MRWSPLAQSAARNISAASEVEEILVSGDARHGRSAGRRLDHRRENRRQRSRPAADRTLRLMKGVDTDAADRTSAAQHPLRPQPVAVGQRRAARGAALYRRRDQPRRRPAAEAVLGAEGPRISRHALSGRDLSPRPRAPRQRADFGRHLWDPSRAPAGQHIVGVEEFAAPRRLFDRRRMAKHQGELQDDAARAMARPMRPT